MRIIKQAEDKRRISVVVKARVELFYLVLEMAAGSGRLRWSLIEALREDRSFERSVNSKLKTASYREPQHLALQIFIYFKFLSIYNTNISMNHFSRESASTMFSSDHITLHYNYIAWPAVRNSSLYE